MVNNTNIYQKRLLLENRKNKPYFKLMGNIDASSFAPYQKWDLFDWDLSDTLQLRENNGIAFDTNKLKFYNHSTIQHAKKSDPETKDYIHTEPFYQGLVNLVEEVLGKTYRMRWAKLEGNQILDYHIDPPTGDRFIIVTNGEHIVELDTKHGVKRQKMLPGEVWYINSNWYHRVLNETPNERVAILGCFDL